MMSRSFLVVLMILVIWSSLVLAADNSIPEFGGQPEASAMVEPFVNPSTTTLIDDKLVNRLNYCIYISVLIGAFAGVAVRQLRYSKYLSSENGWGWITACVVAISIVWIPFYFEFGYGYFGKHCFGDIVYGDGKVRTTIPAAMECIYSRESISALWISDFFNFLKSTLGTLEDDKYFQTWHVLLGYVFIDFIGVSIFYWILLWLWKEFYRSVYLKQ
jgi:hypothetical protein